MNAPVPIIRAPGEGDRQSFLGGGLHIWKLLFVPRCIPHAFLVVSTTARLLTLQTPGIGQAFYRGASEPTTAGTSDAVDLARLRASATDNPRAIDLLGPPPFAPAKVG